MALAEPWSDPLGMRQAGMSLAWNSRTPARNSPDRTLEICESLYASPIKGFMGDI